MSKSKSQLISLLSKKYTKRLVKISILNIAYRRINIPQNEFIPKTYEGVPYMVFKRKSQNKFIRMYHSLAVGVLDAIEKDYRFLCISFAKKNREPLETYNIKIKYNRQDSKSDKTSAMVKETTTEFLKAFTDIPGRKWDENNVELYVELSYNEDTPKEYEPPNFEAAKETLSSQSSRLVSLGNVNTGFHKISVWGKGKNFSDSRATTPMSALLDIKYVEEYKESPQKRKKKKPDINDEIKEDISKKHKFSDSSGVNINWETVSIRSSIDFVNCVCKWDLPDQYETIKCTKCFGTVHIACHGFITSEAINKDKFACYGCSGSLNIKGDMNMIVKLRVILYGIFANKNIPYELQLTSKDERNYILGQLEQFGIGSKSSTSLKDINMRSLDQAINVIFQSENSQNFELNGYIHK